jgi:hypothetical protein
VKIPDGDKKRERFRRLDFYLDLIQSCSVSRVERKEQYTSNRFFWLYGTDGSYENEDTDTGIGPPPGNKIWPHLDQLSSFLYAQDTTRFSVELGANVDKQFQPWVPKLNDYVNDHFHTSNSDITFGLGLIYALVYGSTLVKPLWKRNDIQPGIVLPHNFGVLREDAMGLHRQEAFCHWYTITPSQFRNDYGILPRFNQIMGMISKRASGIAESQEAGLDRIIMSSQSPLGTGGGSPNGVAQVDWLSQVSMNYVPRVKEELIELCELYVWDDAIRDYRIITLADPDVPLFDRPLHNCGWLPHETPFVQITPNPDPNYFWGISEVERVTPLQVYRNRCMAQIDHLQELQAHAPSTAVGFPSDLLEIQYALDTPGGFLNQPDPGGLTAKADRVKIEIPQDLYSRIDRIDQMFEDMSGLPASTQGKNAPGVRSGGHATELAKLGSSRARKRAMIVEDALENYATIMLKLLKRYDDAILRAARIPGKDAGPETKFVAQQFTSDFTVKVDAHSNSPIFVDDMTDLAFKLLQVKAITRKRLLDMLPVPMRQQLKAELASEIEPAEEKAAEAQHKLEEERINAKHEGRPGKPNGAHPAGQQG